jgi:Hemerythrin HHE cation binding domain
MIVTAGWSPPGGLPCERPVGGNRLLTEDTVHFYNDIYNNYLGGVMTEVSLLARRGRAAESGGRAAAPRLTVAEEHMLLLWQVTARAEELLAVAAEGRWPAAELAALAGYVQAEVLRQVSDEEALLFPAAPAREAARLARDHARLRSAADVLARAAAGEQPMSAREVAAATRDFVSQLEHHLRAEESMLVAGRAARGVPGTAARSGHRHEWYPLTEGPVADLDALPQGQAVAAATDRLLRMRHGEQVELQWGRDLSVVWREISELSPGGYRFIVLQDGPPRWRMQVTRHPA